MLVEQPARDGVAPGAQDRRGDVLPVASELHGRARRSRGHGGNARITRLPTLQLTGKAARQFGATDAQINAVAKSVKTLGLQFAADPTRLFGRVTGSTRQWQTALGTALSKHGATASSPFITYTLPRQTPAALEPPGTRVPLPETQVYDPAAEGSRCARRGRVGKRAFAEVGADEFGTLLNSVDVT
jgi:hypothetical protein